METKSSAPMLFPIEPDKFWDQIRTLIREEINTNGKTIPVNICEFETPGQTNKPLYKISEVYSFFKVAKPIINNWIRHGKKGHRIKRGSLS